MRPHRLLSPFTAAATSLAAALLALAPTAHAQVTDTDVRVLMKAGDTLPSGETLSNIFEASIASSGRWAAVVTVDDGSLRRGLVIDGNLALVVGGSAQGGATVQQIRDVRVSRDGVVAVLYEIENPGNPGNPLDRLQIGTQVVLQEGDAFDGGPTGVDGTLAGIFGFDHDVNQVAVGAFVEEATGGFTNLFFGATRTGGNLSIYGGIVQGEVLPDSVSGLPYVSPSDDCQTFPGGGACHAFNLASGGGGMPVRGLRSLGNLIAEDGQAGPAPNSVWNLEAHGRIRTNDSGDDVYTGQLTLSNGIDRGVVYQEGTPLAIEGGGLNGVLGGQVGEFQTASIAVADDGTPFFAVPMSVGSFQVLMAGSEIVLRSGLLGTQVDGTRIASLYASVEAQTFDITPDGMTVLQIAELATGEKALLLAERQVGDPVTCMAEPNSTGVPGGIDAVGSRFLAINDLSVVATDLPLNAFGYLAVSESTSFVANPGGSSGNLCIGPTVGRYVGQVQSSGLAGEITTTIDLLAIPSPTGFVTSAPGDTWYFQAWHRDAGPMGVTSNFTETVSVTVQ
ncbi:MAG: hypothetical protein AAF957_18875 [Planctomycetota bacterium]